MKTKYAGKFEEWAESEDMYERACDDYTFGDAENAWNTALKLAMSLIPEELQSIRKRIQSNMVEND